jgi:Uncharacterized protein conserved in bacteria (DUF2314).
VTLARFELEKIPEPASLLTLGPTPPFRCSEEDAVDFPDLKAGQWVTGTPDAISDWMIVDGGIVCGGFTSRVARAHMSDAERAEMDSALAWTGLVAWAPTDSC